MNYNTKRYWSLPEIAIELRGYCLLICPPPPLISVCTFMGSTERDILTYLQSLFNISMPHTQHQKILSVHKTLLLLSLNKET